MFENEGALRVTEARPGQMPADPLELLACPERGCGVPATVEDRHVLDSTDGPVEHVKIHCAAGHWFNLPTEMLGRPA
jgi:hypothetical protein